MHQVNSQPFNASALVAPAERGYPVAGASALVPGTALRLPVLPQVAGIPAAERCGSCAGTAVSWTGCALAVCTCTEPEECAPEGPGAVFNNDLVRVYPVGEAWASAAQITAALYDHWTPLTGRMGPDDSTPERIRELAALVFSAVFADRLDARPFESLAFVRGLVQAGEADSAEVRLLRWLAGLVGRAFGPVALDAAHGLPLPEVSA